MNVNELIKELIDKDRYDEVLVRTKDGLKKIKYVLPVESDISDPRYYTEIRLED